MVGTVSQTTKEVGELMGARPKVQPTNEKKQAWFCGGGGVKLGEELDEGLGKLLGEGWSEGKGLCEGLALSRGLCAGLFVPIPTD